MTMKTAFDDVSWVRFSDLIMVFVFASSLYAAILYNTGIDRPWLAGIVGIAVIAGVFVYGWRAWVNRTTTLLAVLFIALVLFACGFLRESSYDGLNYHVATSLYLDRTLAGATGLQPLGGEFWMRHYPKAFEYFAYTAKVLTTHFNSGKAFTLLLSVPALWCLQQLFTTAGVSRRAALIAAAAGVYNPVAIGQWATFYVDAAHYYCWTIFSVNLLFALGNRAYSTAQLGIALVLLIGSKLTGPVFAAVSILVFFVAAWVGADRRVFFAKHKRVIGQLALWSFVAVAVIGYSPYVQNVAAGRHILYPVLGQGRVDVMANQASARFLAMNPLHQILLSYFSLPSDCENCAQAEPVFKPSATRVHAAIGALHTADARFAGFGPFFGFMLIACVASFFWRRKDTHANLVRLYLLATLAIVLIHPQSWWARYVPMFYLVPFLVVAGFSSSARLFHVVIALALLNSLLAAGSVGRWVVVRQAYYRQAVATVRDECNRRDVQLAPSPLNWEADLRDDRIAIAGHTDSQEPPCPVDFDRLMVMKN